MAKAHEFLVHIIEDDQQSRKLLYTFLAEMGFRVIESENGQEALKVFDKETPDLFLIDIMMPNIGGHELTQKIRAMKKFEKTPIVMTTALDDAQNIKDSISAGANAYVTKPIKLYRLKEKIWGFLDLDDDD